MRKRRIYEKKEKLVKKIGESIRTCLSEIKSEQPRLIKSKKKRN